MLETVGLGNETLPAQTDRTGWPLLKKRLAAIFKTRTRAEWTELMQMKEICFAPVLSMSEAPSHPHNKARRAFLEVDGVMQPGPAPRFSRTPSKVTSPPAKAGEHSRAVLQDWGVPAAKIEALEKSGATKQL